MKHRTVLGAVALGLAAPVLAAGQPVADVVGLYDGGSISAAEMAEAQRSLHLLRGRNLQGAAAAAARRRTIEWIALVEILAKEAKETGSDLSAERRTALELRREEEAARALRRAWSEDAEPTEKEVTAFWERWKESFRRPRRWVLSSLFKRVPEGATPAERATVRDAAEELRRRAATGEDIATLAEQHSDSATAGVRGLVGSVTLPELRPEIAAVVAELGEGDLSPVIELPEGFVVLLCRNILEPLEPDRAKLEPTIRGHLRQERLEQRWSDPALLTRLGVELRPEAMRGQDPAAAVIVARLEGVPASVSAADFELFLERQTGGRIPDRDDQLTNLLGQRAMLLAHSVEAERLGLLASDDWSTSWPWIEAEMLARWRLDDLARSSEQPIGEDEVSRYLADNPVGLNTRPRWDLQLLQIRIDPLRPRSFYDHLEALVEAARQGTLELDDIPTSLGAGDLATVLELPGLGERDIFLLGRGVEQAIKSTAVGGLTGLVQEADHLVVARVVDYHPPAALEGEAARQRARTLLEARRRQQARQSVQHQVLASHGFRQLP